MADRLRELEVFLAVARARSFTAAGQRLGMSRANVTKVVAGLEARLGTALLNRTTQHVAPTEAGTLLAERAATLLGGFDSLEADMRNSVGRIAGSIRVGVPPAFGAMHLVPALTAFMAAHPGMRIVLCLDAGDADLVRDGLDLSVRIATALKDASHIARHLVRVPQRLVAAPAYLERHGAPATLDELRDHPCLVHQLKSPSGQWSFVVDAQIVSVPVSGPLAADFGEPLRAAALLGAGLSLHPTYMIADDLAAGRLRVVLPAFNPIGLAITAIYPRRDIPARVRLLIDFLVDWLARAAPWSTAGDASL